MLSCQYYIDMIMWMGCVQDNSHPWSQYTILHSTSQKKTTLKTTATTGCKHEHLHINSTKAFNASDNNNNQKKNKLSQSKAQIHNELIPMQMLHIASLAYRGTAEISS